VGEDLKTHRILSALRAAMEEGQAVVMATVIDTRRSVPRRAGSKMLIYADGTTIGSIGGGEMEANVEDQARSALRDGRPRLLSYELVDPRRGDVGVCGGEVKIYLEAYMPAARILVVGAGHIGKAVLELADWLGFDTVVYDDRPEHVEETALPRGKVRLSGPIENVLPYVTTQTHITVVTRNMAVDLEILPPLLASPARSIGVMGSRRRWDITRAELIKRGTDAGLLDRVWAPIGLEINAESPEEIALSVLGEIVRHRRAGNDSEGADDGDDPNDAGDRRRGDDRDEANEVS